MVGGGSRWWDFSVSPGVRASQEASRLPGEIERNTEVTEDGFRTGRRLLTYQNYLRLDELLSCQQPGSRIPDERVFIVTHLLAELVFRQMIFDLAVIGKVFSEIPRDATGKALPEVAAAEDFWRPALTASARLRYSAEQILPRLVAYLGQGALPGVGCEVGETFSALEFGSFRQGLIPASGFQSAQFRLLQRAFGKANLLSAEIFPGKEFLFHYQGDHATAFLPVTDPLILQSHSEVGTPPGESPLGLVGRFDDLAHDLLASLPEPKVPSSPVGIPMIDDAALLRVLDGLRNVAAEKWMPQLPLEEQDRHLEAFGKVLHAMQAAENKRRMRFELARQGAWYLVSEVPEAHLTVVLKRIVAADRGLHGQDQGSFLSTHHGVAALNIGALKAQARCGGEASTEGTGGGGLDYLRLARTHLVPLFPALVAFGAVEASVDSSVKQHSKGVWRQR